MIGEKRITVEQNKKNFIIEYFTKICFLVSLCTFTNSNLFAQVKAYDDIVSLLHNSSVTFDVLANDNLGKCDRSNIIVSPKNFILSNGKLEQNVDKTFTYTHTGKNSCIDRVEYTIKCENSTRTAVIHLIVLKPLSLNYVASSKARVTVGMHSLKDIEYYWYSEPKGGNPLSSRPSNDRIIVKNSLDSEFIYIEARYKKHIVLPRYQISISKSNDSGKNDFGKENPTGCILDGQLLFREDFGGNNKTDPRVCKEKLPEEITDYEFRSTDKLNPNQYALVKTVNNDYGEHGWQQKFSDHTYPNDTTRGYMFLVDASTDPGKFYEAKITGLCDNINNLYFSAWIANVIPINNPIATDDPILRFEILDAQKRVLSTYITPVIPRDSSRNLKWRNYGFAFDPHGYDELTLKIYNNNVGNSGNDFALDDIEVHFCVPSINMGKDKSDTVCFNSSYTFKATYNDDGTFASSGKKLVYRWEYNSMNDTTAWTALTGDIFGSAVLNVEYTINKVNMTHKGYYRLLVANDYTINKTNCRAKSDPIYLDIKTIEANNDVAIASFNRSRNIDVLANDDLTCCPDLSQLKINIVPGSGLRHGSLVINPDKTFAYTPNNNVTGTDSVDYTIEYLSLVKKARVHIVIPKPLSEYNIACPQAKITIGMHSIPGVQYYWYDTLVGGNMLLPNPVDELIVTKNDSAVQSWYIEAKYKDKISPRYKITLLKSDNCGESEPTGCVVDGQLLFYENFGGNNVLDPRISTTGLPDKTTDYTFKATDQIQPNEYALVKYISSNNSWHQKFSDHTHPADTSRGYMFLMNANKNPAGKFYETKITGLCGSFNKLYFSAWVANVIPASNSVKNDPVLKFELSDKDNNVISTYITPAIQRDGEGKVKWKNYGFTFNPKGYNTLTLRIYNNSNGDSGNDFAIDDIEIRLCVPFVTTENKSLDSVCVGSPFVFKASYSDDDSIFTASGKKLAYRWEYSADKSNWSVIGKDTVVASKTITSNWKIDYITKEGKGYYRFIVGNLETLNNSMCRVVSRTIYVDVIKGYKAPDIRVMISPVPSQKIVYLTRFVNTMDVQSVKWDNSGSFSGFIDDETGALDAEKFIHKGIYTYKYTLTSKCGSSSAKAYVYVYPSKNKRHINTNRTVFICSDSEFNQYVQLNRILGVYDDGQWSYPNDVDGVIANNVKVSSAKYGGSRIFNAQKAYAQAGTSYNVAGKLYAKKFKFKYISINGHTVEFTIVVGKSDS
jgi:hypothetical protein